MPDSHVLRETLSIDSLNAYVNVFMTTNTMRTSQLFEDFATIDFKDCFEVKWLKDMTTLPTVSEARLLALWTVLSAKTGGVESFSYSLTQSSFLQLSRSVLSLKGACPDSRLPGRRNYTEIGTDLWAVHAGTLRSLRGAVCRVSCVPEFGVLHTFALFRQCVVVPEGVQ